MKLLSFRRAGATGFGLMAGHGGVIDLGRRLGPGCTGLKQLIAQGRLGDAAGLADLKPDCQLAELELLPPIPDPDKILCVGINYASHVRETGREIPAKPMIFTRFANTQVGANQPMVRPRESEKFDYEGELAVVIGRAARRVPASVALDYVAGYACYNDGSIRDWQRHSAQFTPGKNFPATGGFGPWLTTADEVGDPGNLTLITRLNGVEVQRAHTSDLIFDVPALIAYCSTFTELVPGDVIITGTTGGVGAYREPPLWMKAGDTVEVEIGHVGHLRNPVVDEPKG